VLAYKLVENVRKNLVVQLFVGCPLCFYSSEVGLKTIVQYRFILQLMSLISLSIVNYLCNFRVRIFVTISKIYMLNNATLGITKTITLLLEQLTTLYVEPYYCCI
jgi:hypothetical protein